MTWSSNPIEAFLFDLDRTLLDSRSVSERALCKTMEEVMHKTLRREDLDRINGLPSRECLTILSGGRQVEPLMEVFGRNLETCMQELTLFPGIEDLLQELHQAGVKMAVVTSQDRRESQMTRRILGLDRWISEWVTLEDVAHRKPHPEPVRTALRRLNCSPQQAIMIGDTEYDLHAGRGAGALVGIAGWGAIDLASIAALAPDFVFSQPGEILELVEPQCAGRRC